MKTISNTVYMLVASCSLVMAACQLTGTPAERVDNDIAHAARTLHGQVDKAVQKGPLWAADALRYSDAQR